MEKKPVKVADFFSLPYPPDGNTNFWYELSLPSPKYNGVSFRVIAWKHANMHKVWRVRFGGIYKKEKRKRERTEKAWTHSVGIRSITGKKVHYKYRFV
ncbi:hypothetical protein [Oscillibacter sp.]|uniref:hypothetical protein n=1 Tax=Oscillibacter sp. TaxID=1945593 RepID=UPI002613FA40|nr:hypothetical protein [Oscillibacter sp.]MDD3347525.1 hypothetical protein [Oscillibacter sp.]